MCEEEDGVNRNNEEMIDVNTQKILFPMMEEQSFIEWRKYEELRKILSDSLIVCHTHPTAILAGYLSLKIKDGSWKKLFVALHKKFFQYYNVKEKTLPIGVISLQHIVDLVPRGESDFQIVTPVARFSFRAKHGASRQSWIAAIAEAKAHKRNGGVRLEVENMQSLNEPALSGKLVLRYGKKGKTNHSHTLKPGETTIGRNSSNTLKIFDSRISRNHGKIILDDGRAPIYYDLGSQSGSVINDQNVECKALRLGDKIQIGETTLVLESC